MEIPNEDDKIKKLIDIDAKKKKNKIKIIYKIDKTKKQIKLFGRYFVLTIWVKRIFEYSW